MAKKARPGNNGLDPEKVERYVARIENVNSEWASACSEHMEAGKAVREDVANIIGEAENDGLNAKALKGIIKERTLQRKIAAIAAKLDRDVQSQLAMLRHALGDLGEHAADKAERERNNVVSMPA